MNPEHEPDHVSRQAATPTEANTAHMSALTPDQASGANVSGRQAMAKKTPTKRAKGKKPRRGMKSLALAVIVVGGLGYLGIAPRLRQSKALRDDVKATATALPVVSVSTPKSSVGASEVTLPSSIQAIDQTNLNARTSGYLVQRFVDIGSKVKQGQVLAVIQSPELDQQVSQSAADIARMQAGLGQATADMSRSQAAISGTRSEQTRNEAQISQEQANLLHLQARLQQAQAAANVDKAKVKEATQRLEGARADLNRAHVEEAIAKKTLDRWRALEKADAVAGQEVDEKEAEWESNKAKVDAASAAESSAEADVEAARETVNSGNAEVAAANADIQSGRQRINAARSAYSSSQSNVEAAKAGLAATRSSIDAAKAAVDSSQANLRRVEALQSFEKITAPFSGVITARNVDVGDLINPGSGGSGANDQGNSVTKSALFGLAKTDVLRAEVNVPEDQVSSIRQGQMAEIAVSEFPGKSFPGQVFNVSGALDTGSRTLLVEVRIPNAAGLLKPGMYGAVKFLGSKGQRTLTIPANSLMFDASGTRVAVVQPDGTVHYIAVKPGRDFGGEIEILEGLKGDERVVTNPDDSLTEGTKVTIAKEAS